MRRGPLALLALLGPVGDPTDPAALENREVLLGSRGNPRCDSFRNGGRRGDGGGEARAVGGIDGSRGNSRFLGSGVGSPRGTLNTAIYGHGLDGSGTTERCR